MGRLLGTAVLTLALLAALDLAPVSAVPAEPPSIDLPLLPNGVPHCC